MMCGEERDMREKENGDQIIVLIETPKCVLDAMKIYDDDG